MSVVEIQQQFLSQYWFTVACISSCIHLHSWSNCTQCPCWRRWQQRPEQIACRSDVTCQSMSHTHTVEESCSQYELFWKVIVTIRNSDFLGVGILWPLLCEFYCSIVWLQKNAENSIIHAVICHCSSYLVNYVNRTRFLLLKMYRNGQIY